MKKTKKIWRMFLFVMMVLTTVSFVSCGGDDDDDDSQDDKGWYICNNELLTEDNVPKVGGALVSATGETIVSFEGYADAPRIIHIVDATYLDYYQSSQLYEPGEEGTVGKDKVYQIKLEGKTQAYYGVPQRIAYNKRSDGGIDFPLDGSQIVFAKTDKGFEVTAGYWQGYGDSNKILLKYDLNKVY